MPYPAELRRAPERERGTSAARQACPRSGDRAGAALGLDLARRGRAPAGRGLGEGRENRVWREGSWLRAADVAASVGSDLGDAGCGDGAARLKEPDAGDGKRVSM